mmetsp:Transcript_114899/g.202801  ORF Transcript_114899/g.202801 Transcript_114899/m.202801 type:complete len:89 (+) Transcript_114899:943-1209(+)
MHHLRIRLKYGAQDHLYLAVSTKNCWIAERMVQRILRALRAQATKTLRVAVSQNNGRVCRKALASAKPGFAEKDGFQYRSVNRLCNGS